MARSVDSRSKRIADASEHLLDEGAEAEALHDGKGFQRRGRWSFKLDIDAGRSFDEERLAATVNQHRAGAELAVDEALSVSIDAFRSKLSAANFFQFRHISLRAGLNNGTIAEAAGESISGGGEQGA
jgi:hypothetical protein